MLISLDTNIWIFAIVAEDPACTKILSNLATFGVIVPDQVRVEVERNFSEHDMKQFYRLLIRDRIKIDFETVPKNLITEFEGKGLKKGDAEIGAFCEWRQVDILISDNRDFLRGLSPAHYFKVMSPQEFCQQFNL